MPEIRLKSVMPTPWEPYVRCLEAPAGHPSWQGREWLRYDKFQRPRCCDKNYVAQYAHDIAKAIEQVEGGLWCGVIRQEGTRPEWMPVLWRTAAREWVEAHVLDGPQGAARRMLEAGRGKSLTPTLKAVEPVAPRQAATRGMLESMTSKTTQRSPETPAPLVADFDNDPEFQDDAKPPRSTPPMPAWAQRVVSDDPADAWQGEG